MASRREPTDGRPDQVDFFDAIGVAIRWLRPHFAALGCYSVGLIGLPAGAARPGAAGPRLARELLRAMLLQAFYSIRSERQLMERLEFDLLFRWFVGIGVDDAAWDHSTFSKKPERLLEGDIAAKLLSAVLSQPRVKRLLSTFFPRAPRHADRGLGVDEELPAEGRLGRSASPPAGGTTKRIFMARGAPTRRMFRRPIRKGGFIARDRARKPSSASWATR